MKTIHLMTQDGQPYGSENRCCELCGVMLAYRGPSDPFWETNFWVNTKEDYDDLKDQSEVCYNKDFNRNMLYDPGLRGNTIFD